MMDFKTLSDRDILARCIYGEARGESKEGQVAVAHVVMNRVKGKVWFGKTVKGVILKPYQFSCFNSDDPNYKLITAEENDPDPEMVDIAEDAIAGRSVDPTGGATHYHAESCKPAWAGHEKMEYLCRIGKHLFYRELN